MKIWSAIAVVLMLSAIPLLTVYGLAASINVTSAGLFAGSADLTGCDPDGVHTDFGADFDDDDDDGGHQLTKVTVSGIADACEDNTVVVIITRNKKSGGQETIAGGQTLVTPLSGPPDNNSIDVVPTDDGTPNGDLVKVKHVDGIHVFLIDGNVVINPFKLFISP